MSKTPSYEYELLHQFEVIFRDGEHKTQAATRDYSKAWESIIDNPPAEGVTPIHVYRLNGETCAVIAGMDDLVENQECAMEIARLADAIRRERECRAQLVAALNVSRGILFDATKNIEEFWLEEMRGSILDTVGEIEAALAAAKELG